MKSLTLLSLMTIGSCAVGGIAVQPNASSASHAHAYASVNRGGPVNPAPAPLPSSKCDGSGFITHGDGHRTPCPGCDACKAKAVPKSLIKPAVLTLVSQECADGTCAIAPTTTTASGSCASGSCGTSTVQAGGPVRKAFKGIRERRPVRRLFGRLFGRR